jgi:hypothetical protein
MHSVDCRHGDRLVASTAFVVRPAVDTRARPETLSLRAVGGISGVVRDRFVQPVADAQVVISGTKHAAVTDSNGRYSFSAIEPGLIKLVVRRIGYAPDSAMTQVRAGEQRTAPTLVLRPPR